VGLLEFGPHHDPFRIANISAIIVVALSKFSGNDHFMIDHQYVNTSLKIQEIAKKTIVAKNLSIFLPQRAFKTQCARLFAFRVRNVDRLRATRQGHFCVRLESFPINTATDFVLTTTIFHH
jgi:hypothetical protein